MAIADPIRRDILRMLRDRRSTAGEIAGAFSVSRPAVSRHLRVLRKAGLVRDEAIGRERYYELELGPLGVLETFFQELRARATWERRFLALETEVYRESKKRRTAAATTTMRDNAKTKDKETA